MSRCLCGFLWGDTIPVRPRIGITMGDPGGIGPEIILKALEAGEASAEFTLFASQRVLEFHAKKLALHFDPRSYSVVDIDNVPSPYFGPHPSDAGRASIDYLDAAFQAYKRNGIDGLVTAPIQKESWHQAGFMYPGQTEYCAERTGTTEFCMLMAGDHFRIAVLSTHLSLQKALQHVRKERIAEKIRLLDREFKRLGFAAPRIACAALNPHAGESGAFGAEERDEIEPALQGLRKENIDVEGPIAPEVIFRIAASENKWDVVLALYHDQAMIPLKLIDFETSANVTIGLPLIRTSPDHGTAFDIAGKGIANPGSMIYAMRVAADWTRKRHDADSRA